jgi:hypothetical protein
MEKLGVPNYGGTEGDTEYLKWKNEQIDDLEFKIKAAVFEQKEMQAEGVQPPPPAGKGQGAGGGRPNSNANPPKAEMKGGKGGAPRAIVSTSK